MTGAEAVVEALRREGVTHVFGLPGTTVMHVLDALGRQREVRYVSVRHEQVAAHCGLVQVIEIVSGLKPDADAAHWGLGGRAGGRKQRGE